MGCSPKDSPRRTESPAQED